jgi:hypothetical protein
MAPVTIELLLEPFKPSNFLPNATAPKLPIDKFSPYMTPRLVETYLICRLEKLKTRSRSISKKNQAFLQLYSESTFQQELAYAENSAGIAIGDRQLHRLPALLKNAKIKGI